MRKISPFSLTDRFRSIGFAAKGIATMIRSEHNAWVHTLATVVVVSLGICVGLDRYEWCWIVLSIVSVWTAEALNTSLEFLADVASPNFHPMVERAKDVAAGAVLITCIGSVITGLVIFGPYFLAHFFR